MQKTEKEWQGKVRDIGCIVCLRKLKVYSPASIHHALTGGGGRKDETKVLPLCPRHHVGKDGIHALGRKKWQSIYGTEQELLDQVFNILQDT